MRIKSSISRRLTAAIALPFSLIALNSCQTSKNVTIRPSIAITEDEPYFAAYKKANRHFEVIKNFETKQHMSATLLTNAFRQAIATRHKALYREAQPVLGEVTDQTGFFITSFMPDSRMEDLRNERLWNIVLETPAGTLRPSLVKRLSEKNQWKAFFPKVNAWTEEYLILFPGSTGLSNDRLVKQESITLSLSNKDATILLTW